MIKLVRVEQVNFSVNSPSDAKTCDVSPTNNDSNKRIITLVAYDYNTVKRMVIDEKSPQLSVFSNNFYKKIFSVFEKSLKLN